MSAGLPGLGIGGIFFVVVALVAPPVELVRWARGTSSRARRRQVGRQFAIAVVMIVAVDLAIRATLALGSVFGVGPGAAGAGLMALPLAPIGITFGILVSILTVAKLAQLTVRRRDHRRLRAPGPALPALDGALLYLGPADDLSEADLGGAALELEGCER